MRLWFMNINSWQELFIGILIRVFIIMCILPIHEFAHGWAASKLGDDTARRMGRLTLNPLAHIDWLGAACIILVGFGWAKPVPVNPYRFDNQAKRKRGMALTALAGPLSNLICAVIGTVIYCLLVLLSSSMTSQVAGWIYYACYYFIYINVTLAVFNLLPVYPLDGSRILGWLLPDSWNEFLERNGRMISIVFIVLIFLGVFDRILSVMANGVFNGIFYAVSWIFSLFM